MQSVAFKLAPPDFTVSDGAPIPTRTVVAGNPASYTVTVAALNGFNSAVALTYRPFDLAHGRELRFRTHAGDTRGGGS